jgi:hypothetical protein
LIAGSLNLAYIEVVKTAKNSAELKKAVKAALVELLGEGNELLQEAISEAIEDIGLIRAMDEADREIVPRQRIERLLKRGA